MTRIGYLVPEFPGQTHAFFWREIQALERGGLSADLLSTSRPRNAARHPWAAAAVARTTYLARPGVRGALDAAGALVRAVTGGRLREAVRRAGGGAAGATVLLAAAVLVGRARRRGWRHVHVHSCGSSAHVALVAAALGGVTYSLTLHGPLADYGPRQPEKWRHAAFGLVITERLEAEVAATLGDAVAARLSRAPMGISRRDTERDTPYRPWRGEGQAVLFSCGRLNVAKGHDTLLRALSILRDDGLPVRLAIAGEDEAGGTGYRRELERLIAELELTDAVQLLGAVGEDTVRERLRSAHVFALASRGEPLGVAIMEAMGAGVPVVVGDGGGVRELVDDAVGMLVEPGRPDLLAAAVRRLLTSPEEARTAGERGRARVLAHFTSESSARVLADAVQRVTSHAAPLRGVAR